MSSLPRCVFSFALGFSCTLFSSAAYCQTKASKKTLTSSVSGSIIIHGKAATGIIVGIRSSDFSMPLGPMLKATTDVDGNYRITGIPAGNYLVSPLMPAYVVLDLLPSQSRGKPLLLGEGEDVQGIDFSLERGGVISGKVTDADGRPVMEERITILPEGQAKLRGQDFPAVPIRFQTDDRGMYRIYGIQAGRYKIAVGQAEDDPYSNPRLGRVAYKRTFYPDTTEADEAKLVEVTEGSETNNIDITLGRGLPSFAASGKVVDSETGQPVMGLRIGLRRVINDRDSGVLGVFAASNSHGEFRLENVTAGKYLVFAMPTQTGNETRAEALHFEMIDQDVTGLVLKTVKGLSITGTVVLEGDSEKSVLTKLLELHLQAYVRSETGDSGAGQASPLNADGSFRIGGLPAGLANFYLTTQNRRPPVNFTIVRVERDGIVQQRGLDIKAGENVSGIRVVLSYGAGSIRGEVKLENGPLPQGGRLVVWIKKMEDTSSSYRTYGVDARGRFLIEGVTPGAYELNVSVNIPDRPTLPPTKQAINVTEGAVTNVDVTLDLKLRQGQLRQP